MRVVFWGTPAFALPSLGALAGEGYDVVGVVAQPTRPAGRGRLPREPAVAGMAREEGIPVFQPERAGSTEFLQKLQGLEPDVFVVVAYGQILPQSILDVPPLGCINVHASLLPELRGAAPVNWAIIRGFRQTGITIMRMVRKMDAGPILLQVVEPIREDETAGELYARLSRLGAKALVEALSLMGTGRLHEVEQNESNATFAPRLTAEHRRLDWSLDADSLDRWIRGLDPLPGAWSELEGERIKLFRSRPDASTGSDAEPGTILGVGATGVSRDLQVACGGGVLHVRELQPAGKRRMAVSDWVCGRSDPSGLRFR